MARARQGARKSQKPRTVLQAWCLGNPAQVVPEKFELEASMKCETNSKPWQTATRVCSSLIFPGWLAPAHVFTRCTQRVRRTSHESPNPTSFDLLLSLLRFCHLQIMVQAESSKIAARNGVKPHPSGVGANYELPWLVPYRDRLPMF